MKKRKELDALVSNGKIGSSKRISCGKKGSGSCSAHELLRHDTDSSDMEDFSILQPRRKGRKKHGNRFCLTSVCLSLCQFILVTTSCLVSGALIWLHIGLREDIDLLRAHLQKVEAGNRNTPEALHVIHSKLKQLDSNVTMLYIEVRKNIADIDNITSEIKVLKDVTNNLKESIAAAPAIQQLPKDVHSLSESVASFGSKMTALESNVKELKDQQSSIQTTAQNLSGELDNMKIMMQEITNSTDLQSKSSVNTSVNNTKLQSTVQLAMQKFSYLEGQLSNVLISMNKINATVETLNDAIVWIVNDSHSQNSHIFSLENFIHGNLTLRLEQLEVDRNHPMKLSNAPDIDYINKTISESIFHIVNEELSLGILLHNRSNSLEVLEDTHDILVLLAALLRKFERIPRSHLISNRNATELVRAMLHQVFDEMMASRDLKIEGLEQEVKNITMCMQLHPDTGSKDLIDSDDLVTPLLVQSSPRQETTTVNSEITGEIFQNKE
ncbi:EF-hand calcium-binding domain-containing protein 14-like isoform X2 [Uloborus diversus]|uniref:EF-hand calcium-binding domain-containing protein 14-like isoform X2 n=1 Tax=Uloborus diversus TaxID=327109 RepID=UPI002409CD9C|nr:EF-hand calcium-binding domain-containing protein 14-like isoform X2 [Uloborus diversus]